MQNVFLIVIYILMSPLAYILCIFLQAIMHSPSPFVQNHSPYWLHNRASIDIFITENVERIQLCYLTCICMCTWWWRSGTSIRICHVITWGMHLRNGLIMSPWNECWRVGLRLLGPTTWFIPISWVWYPDIPEDAEPAPVTLLLL
jgi:hypothetical protein